MSITNGSNTDFDTVAGLRPAASETESRPVDEVMLS